ncbi:MAG: sulfotransferase [Chitinophagales bacterium]|nr:sulfotransferase [Chitinophagales bacterium]
MSNTKQIISSNYNQKPIWFSALNGLWKSTYALGTEVKLDKDQLIKSARSESGFSDFGKEFWDEPLDKLLYSMNHEARLHSIGRFIAKKRLENLLCIRLRAEHYFKKYPEILEQKVYPVTAILGLQRTGTTKLQRLLAADPTCRSLRSWEALNPAPIHGDEFTGIERIKFAKMSETALKYMSPGFFAIHPVEHLAPEEDVLLLDVSFMSTTSEATMHVPTYASWLEKTDQSIAYAYSAKLMKLLQWQQPAKKWVIKTPHHLEFPDMVAKHFGDVQFVWTHRNVLEAIPSFLSMVAYSRVLFSNEVNANEVAVHWVKKISHMLNKAMEYRINATNNEQFIDVSFDELVRDSGAVLNKIYAHRSEMVTPELSQIFIQTEANNQKGKYGEHRYHLTDFGIDESYILQYTEAYQNYQRTLFNI